MKKIISRVLALILVCIFTIDCSAMLANDYGAGYSGSSDNPFALMYDSDETLAQNIEKLPGFDIVEEAFIDEPVSESNPGTLLPEKSFKIPAEETEKLFTAEAVKSQIAEYAVSGNISVIAGI